MQTIVTGYTEQYVDTHPYYRSTFIPARTIVRTATGSGVSTEVTGVSGSNQLRLGTHTDYSFPYLTGGRYYLGAPVFKRTADGSGVGTQTAVRLVVTIRTATGSGTADESTTTTKEILARTATGSGVGSGTTTQIVVGIRTATGSGTGTSTATGVHIGPRTATGAGGASTGDIAVGLHIAPRTATGSGLGTSTALGGLLIIRTSTGSGASTDIPANWTKTLIFRPPVEDRFPWDSYKSSTPDHRLFAKASQGYRARNIFQLTDLSYTNVDPLDPTLIKTTYWGGHDIVVTEEEKSQLVAAGYTVT